MTWTTHSGITGYLSCYCDESREVTAVSDAISPLRNGDTALFVIVIGFRISAHNSETSDIKLLWH